MLFLNYITALINSPSCLVTMCTARTGKLHLSLTLIERGLYGERSTLRDQNLIFTKFYEKHAVNYVAKFSASQSWFNICVWSLRCQLFVKVMRESSGHSAITLTWRDVRFVSLMSSERLKKAVYSFEHGSDFRCWLLVKDKPNKSTMFINKSDSLAQNTRNLCSWGFLKFKFKHSQSQIWIYKRNDSILSSVLSLFYWSRLHDMKAKRFYTTLNKPQKWKWISFCCNKVCFKEWV